MQWILQSVTKALEAEVIEGFLEEGMTMSRKGREMGRKEESSSSRECGLVKSTETPENMMLPMEWLWDVYYISHHLTDCTVTWSTILFSMF